MRTKKVVVVPYNPEWKWDFEKIKKELNSALGELAERIEHVGSTSVEGLPAKPCIDIDIVIKDYSVFRDVAEKLGGIGYVHEGNLGIEGREAFKYSDKPHLREHHLYVCPKNSQELRRHITFRDFLRNNPETAKKYGEIKAEGARLFPGDIDKYIAYKGVYIEEIYTICGLK